MKKVLVKTMFVVLFGFASQPLLSEEAEVLVLSAKPYPMPKMEVCKQVLEVGKIIRTDENGALHIPFDGFYFLINVDEKEMRCQMYRHVFAK